MDRWTCASETLIQSVPGGFFWWHPRHLFLDALKYFDCVSIGFQHHVKLKSLVLRPVNCLLTLTLAAADKLTVLTPGGERHPGVVEDFLEDVPLGSSLGTTGAFRLHEVARESTVGGTQALAGSIVWGREL